MREQNKAGHGCGKRRESDMGHLGPIGRQAFTLLEIVMVLVVVGLLVSIVVPRMHIVIEEAKIATTKKNLEALRAALELYKRDNNRYPPNLWNLTTTEPPILRAVPPEGILGLNKEIGWDPCTADGLGGWTFNGTYGDVAPNVAGIDIHGDKYCEY